MPSKTKFRDSLAIVAAAALIASCQAPVAVIPGAETGAVLTLDREGVVAALAGKANSNWQDTALTVPGVSERKQQASRYRTQAALGSVWTGNLPGATTNVPAYRHHDTGYMGPLPRAGESVYVVTDAGVVSRLDATTGADLSNGGWNVLSGLASPGTCQRTALLLSGDNQRLYLLTSGGYFVMVDANTGAVLNSQRLSSVGFTGMAPFIDYSNGGGSPVGSDENVYAISREGSVFRINVKNGVAAPALVWASTSGVDRDLYPNPTTATVRPRINYGGNITVDAFPLVWQGRAYFGSTAGNTYRVDLTPATPVVTSWNTDAETAASAPTITAPVAIDLDPTSLAVSHIFVPVGERVVWIDPSRTGEDAMAVSPPLVVDERTPLQLNGTLASYAYSGTPTTKGPYYCFDWASVARNNSPTPNRWGDADDTPDAVFGATGYNTAVDGNDSYGYMRFRITTNDYGGAIPLSATITLKARTVPPGGGSRTETVDVWRASNMKSNGTGFWQGYGIKQLNGNNASLDISPATRPELLSPVLGTGTATVSAGNTLGISFSDHLPSDKNNVSLGFVGLSLRNYAIQARLRQRANNPATSAAVQWYRGEPEDPDNNTARMTVQVTNNGAIANGGIACQPSVNAAQRKVWVVSANTLFELSYASADDFRDRTKVIFNRTAAGRGQAGSAGAVDAGRYIFPVGNVLFTGNRLIVADRDPTNNRFFMNEFSVDATSGGLTAANDQLVNTYDAGNGSSQVGEQMMFDYASGSAYFTTQSRVVRIDIQ